jgi:hypothetical protein
MQWKIEKYMFMDSIVCDIKSEDCMMNKCTLCPGINFLKPKLVELLDNRATIKYKMWISTDRTMLEEKECTASTFIDTLLDKINKLTKHHFISIEQSKFCRELKEKITPEECLIQGDFSQNYSMFVQDSTQSSFFNPVQRATIHPFIAYLNVSGKISPHSIAVISNCNSHNTVAVHSFLATSFKSRERVMFNCAKSFILHGRCCIAVQKLQKFCQPHSSFRRL